MRRSALIYAVWDMIVALIQVLGFTGGGMNTEVGSAPQFVACYDGGKEIPALPGWLPDGLVRVKKNRIWDYTPEIGKKKSAGDEGVTSQ